MHIVDECNSRGEVPLLGAVTRPSSMAMDDASALREVGNLAPMWAETVRTLAGDAGGLDELIAMSTESLPIEPFQWRMVHETDREAVTRVLSVLDETLGPTRPERPTDGSLPDAPEALRRWCVDDEHRTIMRRTLAMIAAQTPLSLTARPAERVAAALAWAALRSSGHLTRRRGYTATDLWRSFGVPNCSDLARRLLRDIRVSSATGGGWFGRGRDAWLADARVMHSEVRRELVAQRDELCRTIRLYADDRPVSGSGADLGADDSSIAVRSMTPHWAYRWKSGFDRESMVLAMSQDGEPELLLLRMPDAGALISMLQSALDSPSCTTEMLRPHR